MRIRYQSFQLIHLAFKKKYVILKCNMASIFDGILYLIIILFSLSVHECMHAYIAYRFGDPTGKLMGRISLNPISHISLVGTILFPLILILLRLPVFGWANPVPVNPAYLRNPKRDMMWISLAGPFSNIGIALIFFLLLILLTLNFDWIPYFLIGYHSEENPTPGKNALPIKGVSLFLYYGIIVNLLLAFFNLLPVPPLDGSNVLYRLLPYPLSQKYRSLQPYGFLILLILIYLGIIDFFLRIFLFPLQRFILEFLSRL